ncbi:MAG: peptidoglycan-associated lipoprotein Pal [Gammaproteobacteria bacterium]|nr:peptidoglycan-associated lipoprotein Pal [Gammaproteobacteria bacterium]
MSQYKILLLIVGAFALAACSSSNTIPDPDPSESTVDPSANTGPMDGDGLGSGEAVDFEGELPMIIYFDFDSSNVRPGDTDVVSRHAFQLANDGGMRVRLEGHADERGSREYNIGLGERRAQAVRRLLLIQGATAAQISTVSFGEERPQADGSNERAYELNRRVEIKYTN